MLNHLQAQHLKQPLSETLQDVRDIFIKRSTGQLRSQVYYLNDFGRWSWNLRRKGVPTAFYIHTTAENEEETMSNKAVNLGQLAWLRACCAWRTRPNGQLRLSQRGRHVRSPPLWRARLSVTSAFRRLSGVSIVLLLFGCGRHAAPSRDRPQPELTSQHVEQGSAAETKAVAPIAEKTPERAATLNCADESGVVDSHLRSVRVVKDQVGALRMALAHSQSALEECADYEVFWYALSRAGELGLVRFPLTTRAQSFSSAVDLAEHAARLYPRSARIWTTRARLLETEEAAQAAVAIDGTYVPATIALADALVVAGKAQDAIPILDSPRVRSAPGVHVSRSRALLSLGRAREAVASAKRELAVSNLDSPEPFLASHVARDGEEALGLALRADHQDAQAHVHLVSAAGMGSKKAQALLQPSDWIR